MKQQNVFFTLIISLVFFNGCSAQPHSNSLKLIESITLPHVRGRIDYLAYDDARKIVYIAELGNNFLEAVELKNKKVIGSIKNLHEPQGVVFIPQSNSRFVANGDNGECDVFDAGTFKKTFSIKLSDGRR